MSAETASVEVLTAEVRTLMVGNRQVTLSVYRQLDQADPANVTPFGRVNDQRDDGTPGQIFGIGRHKGTGALTRTWVNRPYPPAIDITDLVVYHPKPHGGRVFHGASWEQKWSLSVDRRADVRPCPIEDCDQDVERFGWHFVDDPAALGSLEERVDALREEWSPVIDRYAAWQALPLIVLAGLR